MQIKYYKLGDPDTPQGLRLYTKDVDLDVLEGIHGEVEITEEEYNQLKERFSDPLGPRTDEGAYLTIEAAQQLYDEDERIKREFEEEEERKVNYFANRIKKEIELGIMNKEDIVLSLLMTRLSSSLRKRIIDKINNTEV